MFSETAAGWKYCETESTASDGRQDMDHKALKNLRKAAAATLILSALELIDTIVTASSIMKLAQSALSAAGFDGQILRGVFIAVMAVIAVFILLRVLDGILAYRLTKTYGRTGGIRTLTIILVVLDILSVISSVSMYTAPDTDLVNTTISLVSAVCTVTVDIFLLKYLSDFKKQNQLL